MTWAHHLAVLSVAAALAGPPGGGDCSPPILHRCGPCPPRCACPDDYVRKPCPRIPCLSPCAGPDDYCRKPYPRIPCPRWPCLPDDYCRKPFPTVPCLRYPVWYSCDGPQDTPVRALPAPAPAPVPVHATPVSPAGSFWGRYRGFPVAPLDHPGGK
jgi:hypothetical protein